MFRVFNPIAEALDLMQRETTTIAESVEIWIELLERVPKTAGGYNLVVQRSKQALGCPFFVLANVLDPRFSGLSLGPQQIDLARQFAEEEGPDVALGLNLYLARQGPFRPTLFDRRADPIAWWKAGLFSGFPSPLACLALRLCACLAASANLERNFSTMGHVFGRRRTHLGAEKAGKLTFLFRRLNGGDDADSDDAGSD